MRWYTIIFLLLMSASVWGQNSSSDNTQEGNLNNSYGNNSTVSSNNQSDSTTVTRNYNGAGSSSEIPATSAISPTYMSNGSETCLQGSSSSVQTVIVGFSGGNYQEDPNCDRRKNARLLQSLGMTVAAVSMLCQDELVWRAMFESGTPCPMLSRGRLIVGKRAYLMMKTKPELYIPSYENEEAWYNDVLGIGDANEVEQIEGDTPVSVSERFRTTG